MNAFPQKKENYEKICHSVTGDTLYNAWTIAMFLDALDPVLLFHFKVLLQSTVKRLRAC